jgi:hypothetical protein
MGDVAPFNIPADVTPFNISAGNLNAAKVSVSLARRMRLKLAFPLVGPLPTKIPPEPMGDKVKKFLGTGTYN